MRKRERDDTELRDTELTETASEMSGAEAEAALDNEVSTEVHELREELESLNDRHLRLAAEFDNYRKRHRRDQDLQAARLQADLVGSLLDVLDDLQRVGSNGDAGDAQAVLEGVRLVEKKFMTVLEGAGVSPVDADDVPFDPEVMEALGTVPTDDPEKDGHVADVFQRGYQLRDLLIRPARVRVYQHEEDE